MRKMILYLLCFFIVGCTSKSSKEKNLQTPIDNTVGVNDTLGISLRPEFPVYSTSQKRIIFKLRNNGDANIGFGGYYHYTYKDENGTWRKVPMELVVFDEELVLFPNHEYLYDAEVFQHTPGMYRFFLSINRCGKSHTLMTEFELSSDSVLREKTSPVDSLKTQPKDSSQTVSFELKPIPREIPKGETISSDLLSMQTEYDYYPLSTTEVNVIITNHSHFEYNCGEGYSLAYFNEKQNTWETLPTNPIINSILWIFPPENPTHRQTIELYSSEVPNRPGRYRIYKSFNRNTRTAYAEFELVDMKGVKRIRKRIDDYCESNRKSPNDTTAYNIHSTWIEGDDGDTIYVGLMNNTPHFQEMFRKKVVSYSAVTHGIVHQDVPFFQSAPSDTLHVTMKTERPVYPVGTETISVELVNGNSHNLFFGDPYNVVRKEGNRWILLHDGGAWNDIGHGLAQGGTFHFTARLHPLVNDNKPGIYKVVKRIKFNGSIQEWYMGAEFRIE